MSKDPRATSRILQSILSFVSWGSLKAIAEYIHAGPCETSRIIQRIHFMVAAAIAASAAAFLCHFCALSTVEPIRS